MDAAQPASRPGGQSSADASASASNSSSDTPRGAAGASGEASGAGSAEAANDGMLDNAQALWREFSQLASDHLELALLETRRAGKSAVNMLIYAIGAALLLITAWLGIMAAIVVGLAALGLHHGWGILIAVALNLAGAFALYLMIRSNSANLRFPATARSIKSEMALIRSAGKS